MGGTPTSLIDAIEAEILPWQAPIPGGTPASVSLAVAALGAGVGGAAPRYRAADHVVGLAHLVLDVILEVHVEGVGDGAVRGIPVQMVQLPQRFVALSRLDRGEHEIPLRDTGNVHPEVALAGVRGT